MGEPILHQFHAIAFEENFSLRQLSPVFPQARIGAREVYMPIEPSGGMFIYPFGAIVTYDVAAERREAELTRLREAIPKLTARGLREEYTVSAAAAFLSGIAD